MYDLDDIYHPNLTRTYQISLILAFLLTTLTIIPALYIILTKSRKAISFKYLLINQLFWSYGFSVFHIGQGFLPLFPIPAFYSTSVFKYLRDDVKNVIIPIFLYAGIGHANGILLSLCYRVTYASAFNRFQVWFEEPKKVGLIVLVVNTISASVMAPYIIDKYDIVQLRHDLFLQYPLLQNMSFYEPVIIPAPFAMSLTTFSLKNLSILIYNIYIPLTYLIGVVIYAIFMSHAFKAKHHMSTSTFKKYLIVVRAQTVQIVSITVMMIFPYSCQFMAFMVKNRIGNLVTVIAWFFLSYYLLLEILALMYFVKPYRTYVKRKFFGLFGKEFSENLVIFDSTVKDGNNSKSS